MSLRLQWTAHDARSSNHARLLEALTSLETHLLSNLLGDSVRKEELWTWLMKDAGHLPIPASDKGSASQVVFDLLPSRRRSSKRSRPACDKLLTGLCQTQSDKVALFLWKHLPLSYANVFTADTNGCILSWFDHFGSTVNTDFLFGAKALAKYAISHRKEVWDLLVWSDGQSRAPVAVVAKMHYFAKLDITQTVKNFASHCPRFWSSPEFRDTLEGSNILALGTTIFGQALYSILQDGLKGTSELLALIEDYVRAASWQELVQPLLPQLPEEALLRCCTHALPVNTFDGSKIGLEMGSEAALQAMVYGVPNFSSVDELMMYNGLALHRRQLLRLQTEDDWAQVLQDVAEDMGHVSLELEQTHWAAFLLDSSLSRTRRMKGLILQLFCEHWSIKAAIQRDEDVVHGLCRSNGIVLSRQAITEEAADWQRDKIKKRKAKHSKKQKKRKKHKRRDSSDSDLPEDHSETDSLDFDNRMHQQDAGSEVWDLAIGAYKATGARNSVPELMMSICACVKFEAYVKAHA